MVAVMGKRRMGGGSGCSPILPALCPRFDFHAEQHNEKCSAADKSVNFLPFFWAKLQFCTFAVISFARALPLPGMAVLSMSVQHFLGGLITTLTFTTMMHCTQRAEESIQVRLL